MNRARATRLLCERLKDEVVVSNLGQATLDLQQTADRDLNCYTFGSMGQCSAIGLGIALARPDVRVVSLDGDGSLLMNLGVLTTVATVWPRNYAIVVWDNEAHMTTGGQPTATAFRTDLAEVARGAGIEKVFIPSDEEELAAVFDRMLAEDGPFFILVKVDRGYADGELDRDVVAYKLRFMNAMSALPKQVR